MNAGFWPSTVPLTSSTLTLGNLDSMVGFRRVYVDTSCTVGFTSGCSLFFGGNPSLAVDTGVIQLPILGGMYGHIEGFP